MRPPLESRIQIQRNSITFYLGFYLPFPAKKLSYLFRCWKEASIPSSFGFNLKRLYSISLGLLQNLLFFDMNMGIELIIWTWCTVQCIYNRVLIQLGGSNRTLSLHQHGKILSELSKNFRMKVYGPIWDKSTVCKIGRPQKFPWKSC